MSSKIVSNTPHTVKEYLLKMRKYAFLIKALSLREFKVKYANTLLGISWFFLQPLLVVVLFSVFFDHIIQLNTQHIPYPAFVFSGLILWYIFTGIVGKGTFALLESSDLIHKLPCPKLIILISKIVPSILECLVLLILLFLILFINGQNIGLNIFYALFFFIQVVIFSFSLTMISSYVVIKYRDLSQIIPALLNFGIWLTPVFYPVSILPNAYQKVLNVLNPLSSFIEGLRAALFSNKAPSLDHLLVFLITCIFLYLSFYFFVKFEKRIVENL